MTPMTPIQAARAVADGVNEVEQDDPEHYYIPRAAVDALTAALKDDPSPEYTYRERFTTPFEQHARHEGKPFEVLGVIDTPDENHDADVLPMFRIRIEGEEIAAWPEEVLVLSPTDMSVWVLVVEHRHGTNVSVHLSEAGAIARVNDYAEEWWDDDVDPIHAKPADPDDLRKSYFDLVESESYLLDTAVIEP